MSTLTINQTKVAELVGSLLAKEVSIAPTATVAPHPVTYRGLVTDDNVLVSVIASDLEFAHRSGAALAMIPAGTLDDKSNDPDEDLIEIYGEVANVVSRLVNEATPSRVRLDPGMEIPIETLQAIIDQGDLVVGYDVSIPGYGSGSLGVWYRPSA